MTIRLDGKTAPFFIIAAGVCWGIIGIFSRQLAELGFSPVQIAFGRSFVTAVVMVLFMASTRASELAIAKRDIWMFLGTGLCSIVFFNICYFTAIQLTTLSMAAILLYTAPSIVMVLSVLLFKEAFTPVKALCLVLAFAGCVLVSGLGVGKVNVPGVLAGLGAGFGYALYSIFARYALAKYTPFAVTTWTFVVAAAGLIGFSHAGQIAAVVLAVPEAAALFVLLGVVSTALPFGLYTLGLNKMEAGKASILASVEPLTSTLVGVAVFHELLTAAGLGGIACILGAVVLLNCRS